MTERRAPESDRAGTVRAAGWSVVQMWGGRGLALAAFLWIAGRIDASGIGLFVFAQAVVMAARLLTFRGLPTAVVQRPEIDDGHLDAALWTQLAVAFPVAALLAVFAPPLAAALGRPAVGPPIVMLVPLLILWAVSGIQTSWLRRRMAFETLALGIVAANVVGAAVGVALAYRGFELGSLVGMTLAREASAVLFLWPAVGWRPRLRFPVGKLHELRSFAARASALPVLDYGLEQADNLVIGILLGPVPLGYYAVGARVIRFLRALVVEPMENFLLPAFARRQADRERLVRNLATTWRWLSLLAIPAFAAIAVGAPRIVALTLGPEYAPAVPVIQVLALAGALRVIVAPARTALLGMGFAGTVLRLDAGVVALSFLGFVVGTRWGIVGVAWAHVAVAAVALAAFAATMRGRARAPAGVPTR